jgi:hypothetical protein
VLRPPAPRQLCINFVNERLQQHFIAQCVEAEQREYEAEGLQWTHITFFDNKVRGSGVPVRGAGQREQQLIR